MKLYVPAGVVPYPRVVHINDYHFFTHFDTAKELSSSQRSAPHAVVLIDFDDFDGLAEFAATIQHPNKFDYGELEWGWKSERELYPVPNGKTCLSLDGDSVGDLIYIVKHDTKPNAKLAENATAAKFLGRLPELRKIIARRARDGVTGDKVYPFTFCPARLPRYLSFGYGKQAMSAFIGPREGQHVHVFFAQPADQKIPVTSLKLRLTVISLQLTCRTKNHFGEGEGEDGWQSAPGAVDQEDALLLEGAVAATRRSVVPAEDDEEKADPAIEIRNWEPEPTEVTAKTLADQYGLPEWVVEKLVAELSGSEEPAYEDFLGFSAENFHDTYKNDIDRIVEEAKSAQKGKGKKK